MKIINKQTSAFKL